MGIEIRSHNHTSELISLSGTYLEQNESENNLPIGLAYKLSEAPHYYGSKSPLLLSILEDERVVGVAIMTPPRRIILSKIDTEVRVAMRQLVHHLRRINKRIPGVVGPAAEAQAFSACWLEDMPGVSSRIARRMCVFEARKVADVPLSPGSYASLVSVTIHSRPNGLLPFWRQQVSLWISTVSKAGPGNLSMISNYTFGITTSRYLLRVCPVRREMA